MPQHLPSLCPGHVRPVLDIRDLSIALPPGAERTLAVENVSLSVMPGRTLCIVGESGSGKSMIAQAVMGLLPQPHVRAQAGQILFDGKELLTLPQEEMRALRGQRISMIFQEPMTALNPLMRIGEQIGEVIDAHQPMTAPIRRERIMAALADVGLPEPEQIINAYPFRLSGGQRQRVMIACALILEPALLIADEPTTALDVTTQAQILKLIRQLQRHRNTAVLFITHDFGVVAEIADAVVVMQNGQRVEAGATADVLKHPQHPYTRALIGSIPTGRTRARRALPEAQPPVLCVQNLNKIYAAPGRFFGRGSTVHAVKNISLTLSRGQTLGIVGESGSGKSSLGRCLTGLQGFDSGSIVFQGQPLPAGKGFLRATAGRIQMVFQDPYASLNPRHSVGAAIAGGPIAQGLDRQAAMARAQELLQLVGLQADAAQRWPHEFSGGQRQRIAIARALAMRPALLVADEPVSALDVLVQAQVLELFGQVRKQLQLTMIFITHDLRVAGQMGDHIAVMQHGEIVEYGQAQQILSDPQHPYTQQFIEAVPRLMGANGADG